MPHGTPIADVLNFFGTDSASGLRGSDVGRLAAVYGPNALPRPDPISITRRFANQFRDAVIWLLIAAAGVSAALSEFTDAVVILAIVVLNAALGVAQEVRADRALEALGKLSAPRARVRRDGVVAEVAAAELVPGDVVELEAGDHVPADVRLLRAVAVRVQEASLTGESLPSDKDATADVEPGAPLGDRRNMAHMGTVVVAGLATGVVVATGLGTEIGRVHELLRSADPGLTPLQRRLAKLSRTLVLMSLVVVSVVFATDCLRRGPTAEALLTAVSLAVAAVPEGLPAVVTVALALGVHRMARRNAIIRRLPSVETLGAVTVICSDKTGTLTRNEMTVREIWVPPDRYEVSGAGYAPEGEVVRAGPAVTAIGEQPTAGDAHLNVAAAIMAYCGRARVSARGDGTWSVVGDPTEAALVVAATKLGVTAGAAQREIILEVPFDATRKMMSVVLRNSDGTVITYTKGAPEAVLAACANSVTPDGVGEMTEPVADAVRRANAEMAGRALRVLALAYRRCSADEAMTAPETGLTFVGLVGMIDPARPEARAAVATCRHAGIVPVMITGDQPGTAAAVARELGILGPRGAVMTGVELDGLTDEAFAGRVRDVAVYARVSPAHKLRIVRAWRAAGEVVAMTGDGVNDAPAVRAADIGIAMGRTGTDVTREAAAMVLTDDDFATIVNAVAEGRTILDNIRKFIGYLLATNAGEVLAVFAAGVLGWPVPLLAVQILWINLVTDGLPALAIGVEPAEPDVLARPPVPPSQPLITRGQAARVLLGGVLIAGVALTAFGLARSGRPSDLHEARSVAFVTLVFAQLFYAVGCRSERHTQFELGAFANRPLLLALAASASLQLLVMLTPIGRAVFRVTPLSPDQWALVLGVALIPISVAEVFKLVSSIGRRPPARSGRRTTPG